MTDYREFDIQIGKPEFVVDRDPNARWKLDACNDYYVIGYAKSGEAFYRVDNRSFTVGKGSIVFLQSGQSYSARSNPEDPWSFYSVGFSLSTADNRSELLLTKLPNLFRCSDSPHMTANFSELNRVWMMRGKGYLLKCRSLLLDIIFSMLGDEDRRRMQSAHYTRLNEIIDFMRENYSQSYSVEELSALSGLSSSYFRALFKQLTGMTIVQFQNHLKIDRAKDLLVSHSCNVTEAALSVGFSDVYYFSRMFKQLTGKNPSDYL